MVRQLRRGTLLKRWGCRTSRRRAAPQHLRCIPQHNRRGRPRRAAGRHPGGGTAHTQAKNVRWLFSLRFEAFARHARHVHGILFAVAPNHLTMSARNWGKLQDGLAASYDQKWAAGSSQYGQLSPHRSPCERDRVFRCVVPATPDALRPLATFERALAPPSCVSHTSLTSVTANSPTAVHIVGQLVGASGFDFPKVYARWRVIAGAAHVPSDESGGSSDGT